MNIVRMNSPSVGPQLMDVSADIIENLGHRAHIANVRHISERNGLLGQ
jgi:hypothetical protein